MESDSYRERVLKTLDRLTNADPSNVREELRRLVPPGKPVSAMLRFVAAEDYESRIEKVLNGGPGSGCHGDNCGRKEGDERFADLPPATTLPATMETAHKLIDMSPKELHAQAQAFNRINLEIGSKSSPEEAKELGELRIRAAQRLEEYLKLAKENKSPETLNDYLIVSQLEQFYNEAIAEHERVHGDKLPNSKKEDEVDPDTLAIAESLAKEFEPLRVRLDELSKSDPEVFYPAIQKLKDDLPSLLKDANAQQEASDKLESILGNEFLDGVYTASDVERNKHPLAVIAGIGAAVAAGTFLKSYSKDETTSMAQDIADRSDVVLKVARSELAEDVLQQLNEALSTGAFSPSSLTKDELAKSPIVQRTVGVNKAVTRGYGEWVCQRTLTSLERVPCYEFYREEDRKHWRPWPELWIAAGGPPLIPDEGSDYEDGRMVAEIGDELWGRLNQIQPGDPFPPFAFGSGMGIRPLPRGECIGLGAIPPDAVPVQPPLVGLNDNLDPHPLIDQTLLDQLEEDLSDDELGNSKLSNATYTEANPTEGQKAAGNYSKRNIDVHGLKIAIENEKGGERSGKDRNGKAWAIIMPSIYGYIKGSKGADHDAVDVYVQEPVDPDDHVFVIDQADAETGKFDETKAFLGFRSIDSVLETYRMAFNDGKADQRIGGVTDMSLEDFNKWLDGDTAQPLKMSNAAEDSDVYIVYPTWAQGDWPKDNPKAVKSDGPGEIGQAKSDPQGELFVNGKPCGESFIADSEVCRFGESHEPIEIRKIAGFGLSRARARVLATDIASSVFGPAVGIHGAVRAAGAVPGDKVRLQVWKDSLEVWVSGENAASVMGFHNGSKEARLIQLIAQPGNRNGTRLFSRMVDGSKGLDRITMEAVRDDKNGVNGYYTWARLGTMSSDDPVLEKMTQDTPFPSKRVDQLMASPAGRDWWKQHGYTTELHFDLSPGSYSMNVLAAYRSATGV